LQEITKDPHDRDGMMRFLKSMSEEMADFKRPASARTRLIKLIESPVWN